MYARNQAPSGSEDRWLLGPMVETVGELQTRSDWTWKHSGRVARYAVTFGTRLGLDDASLLTLQCAALLHDIGKVTVPPELLDKATRLSRDEWYVITKHAMASSKMLRQQALPRSVVSVAQSHHEWFNGQGYPMGLEGEAIPICARILSIADAYDAMSSDRPYRPALKPEQIVEEIEKGVGTQFDPALVHKLRSVLANDPDTFLPAHRIRLVSDDPMLLSQMWFAGHPWGWEIETWPPGWVKDCPQELLLDRSNGNEKAQLHLTVVDGRCVRRIPEHVAENLHEPLLWIDPVAPVEQAVYRPLDLQNLLPYLKVDSADVNRARGKDTLRVMIADPYQLFRQALKTYLMEQEGVQIVGEADSPAAYREMSKRLKYQVAIIASDLFRGTHSTAPLKAGDYLLDDVDGGEEAGDTTPTIVLVADEDLTPNLASKIWEPGTPTGKRVYIYRGAPIEQVVEAMKAVTGVGASDQ